MSAKARSDIMNGPVGPTLISLSLPMLFGILSMMIFNSIDAWFVAKLGTVPLAAISLTFPVVGVVATFAIGLGVGAMSLISQSIGKGDTEGFKRLTTDVLSLSIVCVALMTIVGLCTIQPLFTLLGATPAMMPFVNSYMVIWYCGILFYVVPLIASNVLRATGDTKTPSLVMIGGMVLNGFLDPLFIFGIGSWHGYGMAGAAIACTVSRGIMFVLIMYLLVYKLNLLGSFFAGWNVVLASWKKILGLGLPVAFSNAVMPVALGLITGIVSRFGTESLAGFGVATRLEAMGFACIIALSTGISPFTGQNFGAGNVARIRLGVSFSLRAAMIIGIVLCGIFIVFGRDLAGLFDKNPLVIASAHAYLIWIAASIGLRGIHQIIWTVLNVLSRPFAAMTLEILLAFVLWIGLGALGAYFYKLNGLYCGMAIANCIGGAIAWVWIRKLLAKLPLKVASTVAL